MRLLPLVLLAACGGSAATTPGPTAPTTNTAAEEDWRGYLATLTGPSCTWVGASSFVACSLGGDATALIGWEANNRRYVLWLVDANNVRVLPGFAGNAQWTFEGSDGRVTLTKQASGWQLQGEVAGGSLDAQLATAALVPAPAAPAPGADVDWRSELQALVGEWTFTGTLAGNPLEYVETCQWLPSATYVFCRMRGSTGFTLVGWEPTNKRFARYAFEGDAPRVSVGTVTNKSWSFSGDGTLVMTRVSPLEYAIQGTEPEGTAIEGSYKTTAGE